MKCWKRRVDWTANKIDYYLYQYGYLELIIVQLQKISDGKLPNALTITKSYKNLLFIINKE
ncbi:hypothetical protein CN514_04540 [Bacillus sp. AFS001701]|nr:hypothetical protein CN514_04540 [Bacillus sp. AFS001701]